jgi:hypothetical protein
MLARASRQFGRNCLRAPLNDHDPIKYVIVKNICHKNVFQVIVVLLSCQLYDFNYLSLSNILNFINFGILQDFTPKMLEIAFQGL